MNIASDNLNFIKKNFKRREINWLWYYLLDTRKIPLEEKFSYENTLDYLIKIINDHRRAKEITDEIIAEYSRLLKYEYIKWIDKNNTRLIIWLYTNYKSYFMSLSINKPEYNFLIEQYYDKFICMLDRDSFCSLEKKKELLLEMQRLWRESKTPLSKTKWIDPNNNEQITWAWEYLSKFNESIGNFVVHIPANDQETYDVILASLDTMSLPKPDWRPADKQVFLDKIRKAWQQKKFRDADKVKNPYHLPLTKQAKKQLDWLAQFNNVKANIMLETLITKEYEHARLDKNGKALY